MLLEKLTIENFQAIKEPAEIEFGKLTFLYGPNSAGKSAVFDALELLERMALNDPAFEALVKSGTRPAWLDLEQGMVGDDRYVTLTAVFYVEGRLIAESDLDRLFFQATPELGRILSEGARVEVRAQFHRQDSSTLRFLGVTVDGDQVLCYRDRETDYDPYFRPDPVRRSGEDPFLGNTRPVQGEWMIAVDHPAAADLKTDLQPSGALARLLLPESGDAVQTVRGLVCAAIAENDKRVGVPVWLLERYLLPTDGIHRIDLRWFALDPPDADEEHYGRFLGQELTAEHALRLYAQLRETAAKINSFIAVIFGLLAKAVHLNRIRGSRSSVDSDWPLHLLSHGECFAVDAPEQEPGRSGLRVSSRHSSLYTGSRRWGGKGFTLEPDLERVLAAYAVSMHRAVDRDMFGEINETDFPNYCLGQYLHSLRKYRIISEEYSFEGPRDVIAWDDELDVDPSVFDSADTSGLLGTRLVYFAVLEQSKIKSRRTFAEVGSSLGYLFPILVALDVNELCGIEQPELHLHPLAQDQLTDVFLAAANRGRRAIIESHSEVFLLKLAQRIKETQSRLAQAGGNVVPLTDSLRADPGDIRVYYFSPDADDGTRVMPIRFAPDGSLIDDWPDGMFANNWTSGLDRLGLFSRELDAEQVRADWPWIAQVEDTLIRKWLCIAWLAKRLGAGLEGIYVLHVAKITEKCLADQLLAPLQHDFRGLPSAQMKGWWLEELEEYCRPRRKVPGLGWWEESLVKLKGRFPIEHVLVAAMRSHIAAQPWREAWESAQQQNLVGLIHDLAQLRGPAAHSGDVRGEDVERIRPLIEAPGRAGLVLRALGIADRAGGGGLRVV